MGNKDTEMPPLRDALLIQFSEWAFMMHVDSRQVLAFIVGLAETMIEIDRVQRLIALHNALKIG